jgi:DNA-binding MarR family transcriptional regulator
MTNEYVGQKPTFTALPNWLRGKATPLELSILWCLQSHFPDIHPSLNLLAEEACISRRSVSGVLADMERKGWIARKHSFGDGGRKASISTLKCVQ